jgi:hypothetical protein
MFRNLLIRAVAFGAALRYSPPPFADNVCRATTAGSRD